MNSGKITYVGKDWKNRVNILVLNDVTGNNYTYGRAEVTSVSQPSGVGDETGTYNERSIAVVNGNGKVGPFISGLNVQSGDYIGMAVTVGGNKIASIKTLKEISNVSNSAWIDEHTIIHEGKTYQVANDATGYDKDSRGWINLATAHAYQNESTLYVDNYNVVRIIEIG